MSGLSDLLIWRGSGGQLKTYMYMCYGVSASGVIWNVKLIIFVSGAVIVNRTLFIFYYL